MVSGFGSGADEGCTGVCSSSRTWLEEGRRRRQSPARERSRLRHSWDRAQAFREAQDAFVESLLDGSGGSDIFQRLNPIVQKLLSRLERREATVLKMRFGIEDGYPKTWKEIGKRFDLTPEQAEETARGAIVKLRFAATPRLYLSGNN